MQIKCEKSANFFKFVPLCDAFIGFVTSGHEEGKSEKNVIKINISKNTCLWGDIYRGWSLIEIPSRWVVWSFTKPRTRLQRYVNH
jgi:hypothetical protein